MKQFFVKSILLVGAVVLSALAQLPTANLKLHLKADVGTSATTDGISISSWNDQSGNANNAIQATGSAQPIYKTNIINGYPIIRFNGTDQYLDLPTPSTLGIQNSDYEIFVAAKTTSSNVQFLLAGADEQYEYHINGASGARFIPTVLTYLDKGGNGDFDDGNIHIFSARASSTGGAVRVDENDSGSTAANVRSANNTALLLGKRASNVFFFNGDIAEIIIYNAALVSSGRDSVEKYLHEKYGMKYSYSINSKADVDTGTGTKGTLRYAMNRINTIAASVTSTISMTSISDTIKLASALPPINYKTIINGPGQNTLAISGQNLYRPFFVGAGTTPFSENSPAAPVVVMQNFSITKGYGKGGNGASGGGGGAGMGGGIFVNAGNVTIENMLFSGNQSLGGNGVAYSSSGGGGGGFGGDGQWGFNFTGNGGSAGLLGGNFGTGQGGSGSTGGGGAGAFVPNTALAGGHGGFGGGGGAAGPSSVRVGGNGGFGGGGGSGSSFLGAGGSGGFGAASGGNDWSSGGGGGGFGGAIFNLNGTLVVKNSTFNNNSAAGGSGYSSGTSYGGAIFNYGGFYSFQNVTYGSGGTVNSAANSLNYYLYGGVMPKPVAALTSTTNLTFNSVTINGTVTPNGYATTFRFAYGINANALSDTTSSQSAGSGTSAVAVSANLSTLTYGTFYYYRLLATNEFGDSISLLGSSVYDTTINRTNLKIWLSGDKGIITSDSIVSQWSDRSGNNNYAYQNVPYRPYRVNSVINNSAIVRFNGTTSMILPSAATLGIQNSEYEILIVAKSTSLSIQFLLGGAISNYEMQLNGSSGFRYIPKSGTTLDAGTSTQYTNGTPHLFHLRAGTTGGRERIDGVTGIATSTNITSTNGSTMNLAIRSDGSYAFNGDIAEVIMYDTLLTVAQRETLHTYIANKYGMTITNSSVSEPTVQSSALSVSNLTANTMKVTVVKGNGNYRMIIAKQTSGVNATITDEEPFIANSVYGSGTQIGAGNYVVYRGTDSIVTVTGLSTSTQYYFSSVEYNGANYDENYYISSPATGNATTLAPPPTVYLDSLVVVSSSSAIAYGRVNPNGLTTTFRFVYGAGERTYLDSTTMQYAGSGSILISINDDGKLTSLASDSVISVKLIATNNSGTTVSADVKRFFNNTSIPSAHLKLWSGVDGGSDTTSNGKITGIYDRSGNNNTVFQSNTQYSPLFTKNVMNGRPAAYFNGTNQSLTFPTTATLGIQNSEYELFIIAKSSSSNVQFLISGGSELYEYHLNGAIGSRFIPKASTYIDAGSENAYTNSNVHLFNPRVTTANGVSRVDRNDITTSGSSAQSSTNTSIVVGIRFNGTFALTGYIAEIIVYDSVLHSADRTSVENYLMNKYNLTEGVLPVELVSFTVSSKLLTAELNWNTATEINNFGFEIEKSMKGSQRDANNAEGRRETWTKIGFVEGSGTSNTPKEYSFIERNLVKGKYLYRLKQIDRDGQFKYSQAVEVEVGSVPKVFALEQNFPNPFNPTTTISYNLVKVSTKDMADKHNLDKVPVTLKIYDVLGREIATLVNDVKEPGNYSVTFDASKFSSGVYFAKLQSGEKIQLKKLMLVK